MNSHTALQKQVSLKPFNTFGIDAVAANYLEIHGIQDLERVFQDENLRKMPRLILGGGSNLLLVSERFEGIVLRMVNKGIAVERDDGHMVYLRVSAGEKWHDFVMWTLENGYPGLENMSLIPGTVGAAPVQNIGAYGMELKDRFYSMRAFDFQTGQMVELDREDCAFSYRDSVFKHGMKDRLVITDLTFALPKAWQPNISYGEVAKTLTEKGITTPTAEQVSQTIIAIRQRKLPDPEVQGNAGSFFQNPTVTAEQMAVLKTKYPNMPSYPQPDGRFRIAAGWLIDQCGWKGRQLGQAGVCATQALVLVNCGGVKGREIAELAKAIQTDVQMKFGLLLVPEPVFI
ncbi:MAG: UDP-N-acetylmuramate dehydrogenase [Oxalobacter sp.]